MVFEITAVTMDRMGKLPTGWKESCIRRVCNVLSCYLDCMEKDGTCTEGIGYFSYSLSYKTLSLEAGNWNSLSRF